MIISIRNINAINSNWVKYSS